MPVIEHICPNCVAAFLTTISSENFKASSLNSLLYFVISNTFPSTFIISDFWVFVYSTQIIPLHSLYSFLCVCYISS